MKSVATALLTGALLALAPVWAAGAEFADIDADGDGSVSWQELTTAFPDVDGEAIEVVDKNNDGALTPEEFADAVEQGAIPAN